MKKLLIILAVATSSAYSQQINPTGTITNLSVTQSEVCACDSVKINFVYKPEVILGPITSFTVFTNMNSVDNIMFSFNYNKIYKMVKTPLNNFYNDTLYSFKAKIPCNILQPSGANALLNFSLKDNNSSNLDVAMVKDCTNSVGIEEYELNTITPVYYNFSGQIVEPKQGELLIKQVGNKRIKVLIQ